MSEALLELVPVWGLWLVAAVTFLSCLALPVPASLVMLTGGAFAASGDFTLWQVAGAAFAGAVLGDHVGFLAGRIGGGPILGWARRSPKRAAAVERAAAYVRARGLVAVYFTRWLLSPLGPYVNLAGGAAGLAQWRFTLADLAGEATWVAVYTGLGYVFADRVSDLADLLGNASGMLAAGAVALLLGLRVLAVLRRPHS